MKHIPVRLGPLALLLTVISICLSVLAVLSFSNSGADMRLAERYGETVKTRYLLEEDGQRYLDEMGAVFRAGNAGAADTQAAVTKVFERDGYTLRIELSEDGGQYVVTSWRISKDWEEDTIIDNLWQGN